MNRHHERAGGPATGSGPLRIALGIAKWLLIVVAGLFAIYLIAINSLLNLSVGHRLMNSHPEVVQINFSRAWSVWPGCVHVKDADISGQDSQNQFWVTAEHAQITMTPWGIPTKDVTGHKVHGDNVMVHIRRRVLKMPSDKEMAKLAVIKGFPSPLKEDAPDVRVIGVRLEDMKAQHVREIWVDAYRVVGDIDAEGGMYYKPRTAVAVYPSTILIKDATVTTGEEAVVSKLHGLIDLLVEQIDLSQLSAQQLKKVAVATDLHLQLDNLRLINQQLPRDLGITLSEGTAAIDLAVKLSHGLVAGGSRLQVAMPRLQVGMPYFQGRTALNIEAKADDAEKQLRFAVQLGPLALVERKKGKTFLHSQSIRVHGHTADLDITHTPTAQVRADLPGVTAGDLTLLNELLPGTIPADILGGSATVSGHLNLSTAKMNADGVIEVQGKDVAVQNKGASLRGGLRLHALLRSLDLKSLSTDLGSSWLALQDMDVTYGGKTTQHWEARLDIDQALLHPQGKHKVDTIVKVYMKNLQPAVGVIAANVKVPAIAQALTNRENLHADIRVQLSNTTLTVPRIDVKSDGLIVKGQALVSDLQKKPPRISAFILIKLGILPIGLEIEDKSVKPILITPERWYEDKMKASTTPDSGNPKRP
jgi:hypothetical protein